MRLTNVLNRCAAVVRAAVRRVGQSVGLVGRTVVRTARRVVEPVVAAVRPLIAAVRPALSALRTTLSRLAQVAVPVVAVACSRHESPPPMPPPTAAIEAALTPAAAAPIDAAVTPPEERPIGDFLMTFYYIAVEEEPPAPPVLVAATDPTSSDSPPAITDANLVAAANDNAAREAANDEVNLTAVAGPATVPMIGRDCELLAEVSPSFVASVRMQGTGRLRDGRLINVAGACSCGSTCFHILPAGIKWGTGAWGLPLAPFRMVAVDPALIKLGTLLYVPELDGLRMPGRAPTGGFIHDGCVVAADVGGAIKGRQLDLFVARRAYYEGLARRGTSHGWATSVEVWDGRKRCTRRGSKVSRSAAASI